MEDESTQPDRVELEALASRVVDDLALIGLYEQQHGWHEHGEQPVLMMECLLGDLAFSDRVQNPSQVDIDAEFRAMMAPVNQEKFEELREQLRREGL